MFSDYSIRSETVSASGSTENLNYYIWLVFNKWLDQSINVQIYIVAFRGCFKNSSSYNSHISAMMNIYVQFSRSVVSDSLQPHELQHARPPVHHQLPDFTQTHIHRVCDATQPSHPLSSPSPPAPNPSQHQSLFQWVNSSHEVAKVLEFQL